MHLGPFAASIRALDAPPPAATETSAITPDTAGAIVGIVIVISSNHNLPLQVGTSVHLFMAVYLCNVSLPLSAPPSSTRTIYTNRKWFSSFAKDNYESPQLGAN